ncbi:hypothetical protein CPB86DRAFT_792874 [Serendipita vermifera]|nr:hypothetical protein CPB86DRAFT_792874 [Serendipita vermifera]
MSLSTDEPIYLSTPHPRRLPTEVETQHCLTVVDNLNAEMGNVQQQIEKLQKRMKSLEAQRLNHLSFMARIRCLPTDVVGEICKACVDAGISPFLLSQICGRFRDIVINMKVLWGRIHITSRPSTYGSVNKIDHEAYPYCALKCRGRKALDLVFQRVCPASMSMIWEWPFTQRFFNIIEFHSNKIHSLTLEYRDGGGHTHPIVTLGDFKWKSLKHICLRDWEFSTTTTVWNALSSLQLNQMVVEMYITRDVHGWTRERAFFGKIVTLIVHTDSRLEDHPLHRTLMRPSMQSLKYLTIHGNPRFLKLVQLPRLTSLRLASPTSQYLPWRVLPTNLEVLKMKNINVLLDISAPPEILGTLHEFEGIGAGFLWDDTGHITFPRVRSLRLESMIMWNRDHEYEDLDMPSILHGHESIDSFASLHLTKMAITSTVIETIRNLSGLCDLSIDACKIEGDTLTDLCRMLVQADTATLPNLLTLRLSGSWPTPSPINFKEFMAEIGLKRPSLQISIDDKNRAPIRRSHRPSNSHCSITLE